MISRTELTLYLDNYLRSTSYNDYAPNGLQVEGKAQIRRVCTAVTASLEVILQAIAWGADALLVHHGYFWRGESAVITGMKRQRLMSLLANDMNLLAYHLPLDCHPKVGNNACIAQLLLAESVQMHAIGGIENLLWTGKLSKLESITEFDHLLSKIFGREPLHIAGTKSEIQSIAWCSGGAQDYIQDAYQLGVDAYISGEISERTYYQAKELDIHYFSCGHHATERYGIQALGEHLVSEFGLEHRFIDSNNPV